MALTQRKSHSPKARLLLIATLLLNTIAASGSAVSVFRFRTHPSEVIYSDIGQNLTLKYSYWETNDKIQVKQGHNKSDREFLFGEWSRPGFVSDKILLVRGSIVTKRKTYDSKVGYEGNLSNSCSNCTAEITLFTLTSTDFKTYGVYVFTHPNVHPLQHSLTIVRRERARIRGWSNYTMKTQEGNTTSITCRAEGMPRPLVKIQRHDNETVAQGMGGTAVFIIVNVKRKHEGLYYCVVYPKDKTQSVIRKGMKLEVRPSRKMRQEDTRPTTADPISAAAVWIKAMYSTVLILLVTSCTIRNM